MIARRDWWIGVGLLVLALLAHAILPSYLPRYDWRHWTGQAYVKIDRWTGTAERGLWGELPTALPPGWTFEPPPK